ncbi:MAG: VOC family protein [Planctomycetota bacterium]
MNDPSAFTAGRVPSADIAVPEHQRVVAFYGKVLATGERPLWRDDLINSAGQPIIGIGARTEEYSALPLQWMPHIQVADVATSVERALEAGGIELMHGKDAGGKSLWAALRDPGGAAFGIIPADASHEAGADTGRIALCEIATRDVRLLAEFYRTVIGWSIRDSADGSLLECRSASGEGSPIARIRSAEGAWGAVPAVWLLHLPVGDLEASKRAARDADGAVYLDFESSGGVPGGTVLQDPVGASVVICSVTGH